MVEINIIICGRKRSGKDTCADIITKYLIDKSYGYIVNRLALSDSLKQICCDLLNINSIEDLNIMKNEEKIIYNNTKTRDFIINTSNLILKLKGNNFFYR